MTRFSNVDSQFEKLIADSTAIEATANTTGGSSNGGYSFPSTYVASEKARVWAMNVMTLVRSTFGTNHHYYSEIQRNLENCDIYANFIKIRSCAKSALDSLRQGFLFETKTLVEAEVASDYIEQANQLLDAGYKDAAAVIGGSVLERHLREMCNARSIPTAKANGRPMSINDLNDKLAKANAYKLPKKKQITAWADIRNNAAHGDYGKYNADDVRSLLRDITTFCADYT